MRARAPDRRHRRILPAGMSDGAKPFMCMALRSASGGQVAPERTLAPPPASPRRPSRRRAQRDHTKAARRATAVAIAAAHPPVAVASSGLAMTARRGRTARVGTARARGQQRQATRTQPGARATSAAVGAGRLPSKARRGWHQVSCATRWRHNQPLLWLSSCFARTR